MTRITVLQPAATPRGDPPIPLTTPVAVPAFPVDALPTVVADMVNAVAEATQTDPAMAGTTALSVLAACCGGHAEVDVRPGWQEILALFTATVAEPGERKSAVQRMLLTPLRDMESSLSVAWLPTRLERKARRQLAEKEAKAARDKAAADPDNDKLREAAVSKSTEAEEIEVPFVPRLLADDITRASLGQQLAEQRGRLAIVSAEGGVFDQIASRQAGQAQFDLYLKGHCGDPIWIDRKNQSSIYIRRPALTVGVMLQPDLLRMIGEQRHFRGRGLLARFLFALPASKVGRRKAGATSPPPEAVDRYNAHITGLLSALAQWVDDPISVGLSDDARTEIEAIEAEVESALADDGELATLKDWGAKYVGVIARIAGLIHLGAYPSDAGCTQVISGETIRKARKIGEFFKASAINAFQEMGTDPATADAVYLLARLKANAADGEVVSERDMQRLAQRFAKKADLTAAIGRLVDHQYLIPYETPKPATGRPPSPRYEFHDPA